MSCLQKFVWDMINLIFIFRFLRKFGEDGKELLLNIIFDRTDMQVSERSIKLDILKCLKILCDIISMGNLSDKLKFIGVV